MYFFIPWPEFDGDRCSARVFSPVIEQYISSAPPGIPAIAAFDFPDGTYVDEIHQKRNSLVSGA